MTTKPAAVLCVLLGAMLWLSGCAATEHEATVTVLEPAVAVETEPEEREAAVKPVPPLVLSALQAEFPAAVVGESKWVKEKGITLIEVELEQGDRDIEAKVTPEGVIVEIESDVEAEELPQAVKDVLNKTAGALEEAVKIEVRAETELSKLRHPAGVYILDIEDDQNEGEIAVAATCVVLRLEWEGKDDGDDEGEDSDGEDDDEDTERKAKRRAVDPAEVEKVAEAIRTLMPEAVIGAAELEKEDGVMLYSVELTEADKKMEAKVSRTGVVMLIESEMAIEDVPQPVKDEVEKAAPGARITGAEKQEVRAAYVLTAVDPPKVVYEVKVEGQPEMKIPAEGAPAAAAAPATPAPAATAAAPEEFQDTFTVDKANLVPNGVNPYWIPLVPGARLTYANKKSDSLIITILDETRVVDGVTCCVLEERETEGGQLAEISYNFYAIDKETMDVYYFGEAVDIYENDKVVKHEGAWISGQDGARFGLMMPGKPEVGQRFYQEIAGNAKDRAEITSVSETVETPAGTFENCVRFLETSPLERGTSTKCFAAGVGMVRDDGFLLTKIEMPGQD